MRIASLLIAVLVCGCVDDKGPESDLAGDGKADSQRKPTDHGAIAFGTPAFSELTDAARYHAWTFELTGDAHVDLTTSYAVRGQRRVDTVLYLYKQTATGWGSYIARNDDYGTTTYSQLIRDLDAGHYRALVKGYAETTYGKFKLTAGCSGAGCAPAACLFGATYHEIAENPAFTITSAVVITPATLGGLSAIDRQHVVDAVKQSAHTDVTTPEEAISRVDQQEINMTTFTDATQRTFVAFEYGAGDNSYGAIFARSDESMAAAIHDGDLYFCTVH